MSETKFCSNCGHIITVKGETPRHELGTVKGLLDLAESDVRGHLGCDRAVLALTRIVRRLAKEYLGEATYV